MSIKKNFNSIKEAIEKAGKTSLRTDKAQDFLDTQETQGRENIGIYNSDVSLDSLVRVDKAQDFLDTQETQGRENIGIYNSDVSLDSLVRVDKTQSFTDAQKQQGRENLGIIKTTGDKGDKGATGATGPKGDKGDKGATGATGPKGDKGDKGATGATGPKGDKGDKGATGATGPKGDKGDKGATGATGPKGDKGDKGATGATGPKGDKGDKGATGATGPKGDKGDKGDSSTVDLSRTVRVDEMVLPFTFYEKKRARRNIDAVGRDDPGYREEFYEKFEVSPRSLDSYEYIKITEEFLTHTGVPSKYGMIKLNAIFFRSTTSSTYNFDITVYQGDVQLTSQKSLEHTKTTTYCTHRFGYTATQYNLLNKDIRLCLRCKSNLKLKGFVYYTFYFFPFI